MKKEIEVKELENVSGGTVDELADLMAVIASDNDIARNSAYVPGLNAAEAYEMRRQLKMRGIQADISIGWGGTDLGSEPNKYTNMETGESMSHMAAVSVLMSRS